MNNLKFWNEVREVPESAKKSIKAGKLKGYTDINPIWRIKVLTEQFGLCGVGWYTEIVDKWSEIGANGEIIFNVILNLYIKYEGEWSKPIQGTGGNKLINKWSTKTESNDEAIKMAETDALSVACKKLGIAADVYFEKDRTKHDLIDDEKKNNNLNGQRSTIGTTTATTNPTATVFKAMTDDQRKFIFGNVKKKMITKELLDIVVQDRYKKRISELNTTEASQMITYTKGLLDFDQVIKLQQLAKRKGINDKQLLQAAKNTRFEYLSDVDYQQLVNRLGKLPDKEGK